MFREIGLELSVRESAVIGIFDLDNVSWSKQSRAFLSRAEAAGEVVEATDSLPKSFVLTQEYGMQRVYLTKNSAEFHAHLGYRMVGGFTKCGYKFHRWYGMVWMEKLIGEHLENQPPVIPFPQIRDVIREKYGID